jgi:O-antigen ligase
MVAVCSILSISLAISQSKWIYLGIALLPGTIYISLSRPFVFPFGLYAFLLPFEGVLVVTDASQGPGPTITRFLGLFTILVLVAKGAVEKKLKSPDKIATWWTLFILYAFLSVVWAIQPEFVYPRLPTALGLLLVYLVVSSYQVQKNDYETIKTMALMGGFLTALIMVYQFVSSTAIASRMALSMGDVESGLNKQGFDLLIPMAIGIGKMMEDKTKLWRKGVFGLMVVVCIFAVIITGSRGNLSAVLGMVLVCIVSVKGLKNKILISGLFVLATALIIPFIPPFVIDRIQEAISSHASGRSDIWFVGWKSLEKYWFFGAGLDNFTKAYTEFIAYTPVFIGVDRASHNIFVGLLVELGLVGISIMLVAMITHYRAIRTELLQSDNDRLMLYAAFWGIIISGLSQDILWYKSFWLLWILIVMHKYVMRPQRRLHI